MLPEIPKTFTEIAKQKAETAVEVIKNNLPNGVVDKLTYDKAKEYWNVVDNWYKSTKDQRLEFTRQIDEVKKQAMEGEKLFLPIVDQLKTWCTEYDNAVAQSLEIENYKQQFETRLLATLKSLAIDHAQTGKPASMIDLSKVMTMPYQSHLKTIHVTLATEWQEKATRLYLTYYNESPKGESAVEEKQMVQAVAQLELASLESEKLEYKPTGARSEVQVVFTHTNAIKTVFAAYMAEIGGAALSDKNLSFLAKWAAKLPEERISKMAQVEGISVIKSIKTTKR
jgi:hypothetical protein